MIAGFHFVTITRPILYSQLHPKMVFWFANFAGSSCAAGGLSINSNCYKKFDVSASLSWFNASNRCLYIGGSLAAFSGTGRPSDNTQLTDWLDVDKTYWIGLVRPWWKTTDKGF